MPFLASAWYSVLQNHIVMDVLQTVIYIASFIVIFWLFFKSVNYFEKI